MGQTKLEKFLWRCVSGLVGMTQSVTSPLLRKRGSNTEGERMAQKGGNLFGPELCSVPRQPLT